MKMITFLFTFKVSKWTDNNFVLLNGNRNMVVFLKYLEEKGILAIYFFSSEIVLWISLFGDKY